MIQLDCVQLGSTGNFVNMIPIIRELRRSIFPTCTTVTWKTQDHYLCVCHRFHRCLHRVHQQLWNQRCRYSLSEAALCRFGTLHANLVPKHLQRPDLGRRCGQDAQSQLGVGISLCCLCYLDGTLRHGICCWVGWLSICSFGQCQEIEVCHARSVFSFKALQQSFYYSIIPSGKDRWQATPPLPLVLVYHHPLQIITELGSGLLRLTYSGCSWRHVELGESKTS